MSAKVGGAIFDTYPASRVLVGPLPSGLWIGCGSSGKMFLTAGDPGVETFKPADLLTKAILRKASVYTSANKDKGELGISRCVREDCAG